MLRDLILQSRHFQLLKGNVQYFQNTTYGL